MEVIDKAEKGNFPAMFEMDLQDPLLDKMASIPIDSHTPVPTYFG